MSAVIAMGGVGLGVALFDAGMLSGGPNGPERRLCDQAVAALLHSRDLVEVERGRIIVRELNCSIGRRLTEEQK
jgi:hypothetical protein